MNPRDIQIMQAQNNPSILSPLSGASKPTTMTAPPQTPMNPQLAQQASTQMANSLYGPGVKAVASNVDDMVKQLFAYDQKLEQGASPFPQVQGYVDNPADIMRGASSLAGIAGSNIGQGLSTVRSVESGYQNAISSVMDSFLRFAELQEKRREQESSERNSMLQWILERTGGTVKNPVTGEDVQIPATVKPISSTSNSSWLSYIPGTSDMAGRPAGANPSANISTVKPKTPSFTPLGSTNTAIGGY